MKSNSSTTKKPNTALIRPRLSKLMQWATIGIQMFEQWCSVIKFLATNYRWYLGSFLPLALHFSHVYWDAIICQSVFPSLYSAAVTVMYFIAKWFELSKALMCCLSPSFNWLRRKPCQEGKSLYKQTSQPLA